MTPQEFDKALADATTACSLDPQNPKALLRKGTAAFELEKFELSREAFKARPSALEPIMLHIVCL